MIPELESLGSVPWAVGGTALLFAAAMGLGQLILGPAIAHRWRGVDANLVRVVVGLNLLALCGIVLGLPGWLTGVRSMWLLIGLSLLNVWFWPNGRQVRRGSPDPVASATGGLKSLGKRPAVAASGSVGDRPQRMLGRIAAALTIALVAITLGPALCYPAGWDELTYHNVLPRRWLADGRPAFYADLPYSGFPSLGEILFWLVAPLESVIAPRLIAWTCWLVGLACLYRVLRRTANRVFASLLTFVVACSETLLLISANCYVESILLMNVAAILLAVQLPRRADQTGLRGPPALLGILVGGAAAIKLTGLAVLPVPILWYAGAIFGSRPQRKSAMRSAALFLLIAIGVAVPFFLRPYLATGNPFYPYFAEWFTTDAIAIETSRYHHAIGGGDFGVRSVQTFVTAPMLLSFDTGAYDGTFGWQFLLLLPLAILGMFASSPRIRRMVIWTSTIAGLWYVFWYATAQQARFAVPAALAVVIAASFGLRRLHRGVRLAVSILLLLAAVASMPWRNAAYYQICWHVVAGQVSRTDYVHNLTGGEYLPLVQALQHETPVDAKLMLLFEHRGLYLQRRYVLGTPCFQERGFSPPEKFTTAEAVLELLARDTSTHVVATTGPAGPDKAPGWSDRQEQIFRGLEACVAKGHLRIVWKSEKYWLFVVESRE